MLGGWGWGVGGLPSSFGSFGKEADETMLHFFYECNITKEPWNRLGLFFNDCFHPPQLFPQTPLFGLSNTYSNKLILKHYIIWLFKLSLYNSRKQEQFTLRTLIKTIAKVKDIEKESLETMIKILCCATINGKILKICRLWSGDIILLLFLCCFC